jgi:hypothetical protein
VRIRREHHPLQGRSLAVYGWTHRHGRLVLILVLPDGSKSLVPAGWTDLAQEITSASEVEASGSLASVSQLLRVRAVVDALLARKQESEKSEAHDSAP